MQISPVEVPFSGHNQMWNLPNIHSTIVNEDPAGVQKASQIFYLHLRTHENTCKCVRYAISGTAFPSLRVTVEHSLKICLFQIRKMKPGFT